MICIPKLALEISRHIAASVTFFAQTRRYMCKLAYQIPLTSRIVQFSLIAHFFGHTWRFCSRCRSKKEQDNRVPSQQAALSMILSMHAESIILSAPPAENMMLSAPQKHRYRRVFFVLQTCVFFLLSRKLPQAPDFCYSFGFS